MRVVCEGMFDSCCDHDDVCALRHQSLHVVCSHDTGQEE